MLRLEEKIKEFGITNLAKKMSVGRATVYYYIKQDEKNSISQLKKIAEALECDFAELFNEPKVVDVINCPRCGGKIKVVKE